jgi:hypothetical protein
MLHALGFSNTEFNPAEPGRLCRGRERWIEPWKVDGPVGAIHRLVISGATFTDDSARDALRGLPHSKVETAAIIAALFPYTTLLAFMEDGHPADIPEETEGVELYQGYRAGGLSEEMLVRWYKPVEGLDQLREILGSDPQAELVRGFAVLEGDEDLDELWEHLFVLVGMSTMDSPPARYQPAALPELLGRVPAVVLLHRDKHGPALGVYSREPVDTAGRLETVCEEQETLLVPFAIPPMLARWDRALAELREVWIDTRDDDFPVPPSAEPSSWEPRWKRRQRRKEDAQQRREMQAEPTPAAEE